MSSAARKWTTPTSRISSGAESIPGVTADLSSGDAIKIKLRGIENQRYMGEKPGVAIVIDGVPVFERTGKVNIDLDNIESIRVIKGGASYLFGDDGLSGAVIITTKRGAKYAGYTLGAEAGSFGFTKQMAGPDSPGKRAAAISRFPPPVRRLLLPIPLRQHPVPGW